MNEITKMLQDVPIPHITEVRQSFCSQALAQPEKELLQQLEAASLDLIRGAKIAITAGSRGIDNYVNLLRGIVLFVKSKGACPFIVPAMGSHGGSTAEGQESVLAHLGITERTVGAPIRSSVEVTRLGTSKAGLPVLIDKIASQADGIILLNRVKPHTAFRGTIESGLVKMLAIGLAKPMGARMTHYLRLENMPANIIAVGSIAMSTLPIVCGVATIEDGYGKLAEIHVLKKDEILSQEPGLLKRAWEYMPRIYLDHVDAMIIQEIGKEISGSGMDSNIVGRGPTESAAGHLDVTLMGLLDVTDKSNGNANGMGFADFTTRRLFNKINYVATYMNTLTSTQPKGTKIPMILDTDKMVFQACVRDCGKINPEDVRLVVIRNTKDIDKVYMSKAAAAAIDTPERAVASGRYRPIPFDENGGLTLFADAEGKS